MTDAQFLVYLKDQYERVSAIYSGLLEVKELQEQRVEHKDFIGQKYYRIPQVEPVRKYRDSLNEKIIILEELLNAKR